MMRQLTLSAASIALISSLVLSGTKAAHAQDDARNVNGPVITGEGISDDIDKKRRGPVVSVGTHYFGPDSDEGKNGNEHARILVDAYIPNEDYQKYPIRVDFYVNRNLFTSQIRSTELPGPLGITVAKDKATVPFNYSVVATLLHPNREFTTVINGAVFSTNLNSTAKTCSLTITEVQTGEGNSSLEKTYVAEDVEVGQLSNNGISLNFESSRLEDGSGAETLNVSSSLSITDDKAAGTVTTTLDGRSQSVQVEGEATIGDSGVETFSVKSEDGFTSLSCE